MKKLLLFFALVAFFSIDLSAQQKMKKDMKVESSINMPRSSNQRSSSSRTLIFEKTANVRYDRWYNIKHYKRDIMNNYKYEVEVSIYNGDGDLYIYGENANHYRQIRYSKRSGSQKEKTYYKKTDLRNHENICFISIYGKKDTRFKIRIYKVKMGGGHGNDCVDPSKIDKNGVCTKIYKPVCGCDGKTYSNKCEAETYYGITKYTEGPCNGNGGGRCTWDFWYDHCKDGKTIQAGKDYYVLVKARKHQDIEWMELYLNGRKVRRENSHPYEWGRPNDNGDHALRNLKPGTYKLKCVVKDKCGKIHEKYCTFYVKNGGNQGHCKDKAWYHKAKHNTRYRAGKDVYVHVKSEKYQDIEWMELYVNNRKVRRENAAPYEWGKPNSNGDHLLRRMKRGTYKLKCKYKTKCGKYLEKYSTIYVD